MRTGLGVLRLAPAEFWRMTPRELASAVAGMLGPVPPAPLSRADLIGLMTEYPDAATS